jgi:membrane fusion protein (multidrug efflux system)
MSTASDLITKRSRTAARSGWRKLTSRRWLRLLLMVILPLALISGGAWWYLNAQRYVSTDDAYVQADTVTISSDVAGRVVEVDVHDNQSVKRGDVLFKLDPRPYKIAVEHAAAQLASARLQVEGLRATYRQDLASLKAAQDTESFRQREFDRAQRLLQSRVVSEAAFDQAEHNLEAAQQQVAAAKQQAAQVLASLGGNADIPTDQHPLVRQAQAQLDQARLNLSYTVVHASVNGTVANVDKLPVGTYLNAAQPAFSLVSTDDVWIQANYKETELAHMRPGQEATVSVDSYPGVTFKARVESLSPGTGSEFSVLPPQNATGNWVMVVQRLPVHLAIENPDPQRPLRAGMSVSAEVDTHYVNPIVASVDSFFGIGSAAASTQR